jgi:hypothetical protein
VWQQWVEVAGLSKDAVVGAGGRPKPVGSSSRVAPPFGQIQIFVGANCAVIMMMPVGSLCRGSYSQV